VCYAFFGAVSDLGYTYSQNLGRAWVDAELGTTSQYVEGVAFLSRQDQENVMDGFAQDGCTVITLGSNVLQSLAVHYANLYPYLRFLCLTCRFPSIDLQPENMAVIDISIHQASYIAGVIAAMQPGVQRVGYVGANYVPASFKNVNAFALGAMSVRSNVTLYLVHVGSWLNSRTERIVGKQLVRQQGVELIAYDSDSAELVRVAREEGVLSIAIKVDGTATFGESNLMSRVFQWSTPLLTVVRAALNHTGWNWTDYRAAFANAGFQADAVSLGTYSTSLETSARIRAEQIKERFEIEGDFTFCWPHGRIDAVCPPDAVLFNEEINAPPAEMFPCNISNNTVYAADGECLSDEQIQEMSWAHGGYTNLGLVDVPAVCARGTWMSFSTEELCMDCEPGSISLVEDTEVCELCALGRYALAGLECRQCRAGSFSSSLGSSACTECPIGTYTVQDGQTACLDCIPGYFSNVTGAQACGRCAIGFYSASTSMADCTQCGDGETTQFEAASSPDDCVCPFGLYRVDAGYCVRCPEGMECPVGSNVRNMPDRRASDGLAPCPSCPFPRTVTGFMTLEKAPLLVYKCQSDKDCPGAEFGVVSSCGPLRAADAVACGLCQESAFRNRDGDCEECTGGDQYIMFVLFIVIGTLGVIAMAIGVNRNLLTQQSGTANLVIIAGIFLTALQTTIVFNQLALDWVDPISAALDMTQILNFDMGSLKMDCVVRVDPVSSFLSRQMVAPACVPILIASILVKKWFSAQPVNFFVEFINAAGAIFSCFFLSVVTTSVDALVCYPHPDDSNTGSSVIDNPAVLCWADERHRRMVTIAVVSFLLVPANFFSICVYAVVMHSRIMARNDDRQRRFHHSFRFLFFRFTPGSYRFGVLLLIRNLVICLIPAALTGKVGFQVALLCAIILAFGMLQATQQPWRTRLVNRVDSVTSTVLALILVCGIMNTSLAINKVDMAVLSTSVISVAGVTLTVAAAISLKDSLFPDAHYHHFLCHHKRDAAAQARFIQMLIMKHLKRTCFLDSDDLKDLSKLFDIVRTRVKHFLVYLTRDTLRRPWCAGEIVVTKETKLKITKIVRWDFEGPSPAELADIGNYLAQGAGVNLVDYNMDYHQISSALAWVSTDELQAIHLGQEIVGTRLFFNAVMDLAKRSVKPGKLSLPEELDTLVISTDGSDVEATAAGGIILEKIHEEAAQVLQGSCVLLADFPNLDFHELRVSIARARVLVVVLSRHTLDCLQQLQVVMVGMLGGVSVTSVVTPQFQFPGEAFFHTSLPSLFSDGCDNAVRAMKNFFEQIAVPLSTHGSSSTLRAETSEVVRRVPADKVSQERHNILAVDIPPPRISKRSKADNSQSVEVTKIGLVPSRSQSDASRDETPNGKISNGPSVDDKIASIVGTDCKISSI